MSSKDLVLGKNFKRNLMPLLRVWNAEDSGESQDEFGKNLIKLMLV